MRTATFLTGAAMAFSAVLVAVSFNLMLVPHELLSGGISGVALIVGYATGWQIGTLYLILNLPILVWGWRLLGRRFVAWSVCNVAVASAAMAVIPVYPLLEDLLAGAIAGGVLLGLGSGIALRAGGSTGGLDIVASIITRRHDLPIGMILFLLNGAIVASQGVLNARWDMAFYSMLSIFASGKVIDAVHVRQVKVTVFIITNQTRLLLDQLLLRPRGVSVIPAKGGFSGREKDMLMTVTTRYELAELQRLIRRCDPGAFVNIVETAAVMGEFRRV